MKVLFVTDNLPVPPIAGSSQRTSILLRALKEFAEVDLFILRGQEEKEFMNQAGYKVVGNYCSRSNMFYKNILRVIFPLRDYLPDKVTTAKVRAIFKTGNYDVLVGRYIRPSLVSGLASIGPAMIDIDDFDLSVLKNRIASTHTPWWLKLMLKYRLFVIERKIVNFLKPYKCLLLASDQDLPLVQHNNRHVVPNISYNLPDPAITKLSTSTRILWVGSFNHRVNLEGLDKFIMSEWSKVIEKSPRAILRVVGSHLPKTIATKWNQVRNVEIAGYVEDLELEYSNAAFSIVPLWDGAGTKIKVLESLMFQRTAVVTEHAVRGLDGLKDNESLMVASSSNDFINKTTHLLREVESRHKLEKNGFNQVQEHYSYARVKNAIKSAIESI